MNDNIKNKESLLLGITSVLCLAVLIFIFCIFYIKPVFYVHLIAEDSWGEYSTFVFYAVALFLMVFLMLNNKTYFKPGYALISLCFLFMAMEEISWGQRIFGVPTPEVLGNINRQGEITLHNLVRINRLFRILSIIILLWAIVLPWLIKKYEPVKRLVAKMGIPVCAKYLWPFFILSAFFIIGRPLPRAVEVGEMLMGFAFMAYSLDTMQYSLKQYEFIKIPLVVQIICISGFVFFMTNFLVINWPNNNALRVRYCDFVSSELPKKKLAKQSEKILRYLIKNPDFMTIEFLSKIDMILKKLPINVEQLEINNIIVREFLDKNDIKFSVYLKRKIFNMRKTDYDEERALALHAIGVEYYRLQDFKTAVDYFQSSLKYTSEKSTIDKTALYFSESLR